LEGNRLRRYHQWGVR